MSANANWRLANEPWRKSSGRKSAAPSARTSRLLKPHGHVEKMPETSGRRRGRGDKRRQRQQRRTNSAGANLRFRYMLRTHAIQKPCVYSLFIVCKPYFGTGPHGIPHHYLSPSVTPWPGVQEATEGIDEVYRKLSVKKRVSLSRVAAAAMPTAAWSCRG